MLSIEFNIFSINIYYNSIKIYGAVAERLRTGLQSRVHRFESGPHLHKINVFTNIKIKLLLFKFSGVAQLVEQATVNRWVTGSSPVAGAKKSSSFWRDIW